jgi:hypothetical protein
MVSAPPPAIIGPMSAIDTLNDHSEDLIEAAAAFYAAASEPGGQAVIPDSLARCEEALQLLSGAWYQLAADATSGADALSHEQEVGVLSTLHDVAAAFARCARECRHGRSRVSRVLARNGARDGCQLGQ